MIGGELLKDLARLAPVRAAEPMSRHTTFGVGGPADIYVAADSEEMLCALVKAASRHGVPVFVLGSGSNILVGDGGIRGVVIENRVTQVEGPMPTEGGPFLVRAGSGASFASLARRLSLAGWAGMEWAVGIPGTMGGAVVYNAGAYGGCLADVLRSVRVADGHGHIQELAASQLRLGYRGSAFARGLLSGQIVLSADLVLRRGDPPALARQVAELDARRLAAQPRGRNAGSIFKNPRDMPAWRLIERVGLRGHRISDAQISDVHTNFIVNYGQASAADVVALMELAQRRVWEEFGVQLEREVSLVGEGFA
ncbi:MAG: UDP-N-acetylmuramate dehydrogenase [Dehalococcoidia bacterium]